MVDPAEIDRRMAEIKTDLQPHFDRSPLTPEQQAEFYEYARQQIPVTMEKESRGVSDSQIFNARQARLQTPHHITEQEFTHVLLPSLMHISYIHEPGELSFNGNTLGAMMYLCASTDWKLQREGKEGLIGKRDDLYVSSFIHVASDNYRVLMACEREGIRRVKALCSRHLCDACKKYDSDILDAAPILDSIRAGFYPFGHAITNEDLIEEGDEVENVYLCPGPKLMILDNGIDPDKFKTFMSGVKEKMAQYQRENL